LGLAQQLWQLGNVRCNPSCLILRQQLGRRLPAFAIVAERGRLSGRKAMEWFKQKTSIAGVQVSNWMIVLGAIIIVLLIIQNTH
jgi:hypothetical protein